MGEDLKQKIMEEIEEEHLEPRPSWWFRLMRTLKHSIVAILFVLTATGLSFSVYILVANGTLADLWMGPRWLRPRFFDFPWQLLLLVVLFGFLSFIALRGTARLYRISRGWLILALVGVVIAGAGAAYAGNLPRVTFRTGPGRELFRRGGNLWGEDMGNAVVGVVTSRTTEQWVVDGITGERWLVIVTQETYFPEGSDIPVGTIVRIVGPHIRTTIHAVGIRPVPSMHDLMQDMMRSEGGGLQPQSWIIHIGTASCIPTIQ